MWIRRMARCTSLKIQPPAIAAAADAHGLLLSCRSSDHGEKLIRDEAGDVTSPASFPNHNVTYFCFTTLFMEKFMFLRDLLIPSHLFLLLGLFVLFFGGKKLLETGKGLGDGIRSFKASVKEINKAE